jgi:hypothetical protein
MEGSGVPMNVSEREPGTLRLTQAGLLIASLGAVMVIVGAFGIAGLILAAVGAAMAAPGGFAKAWYWGVAGGAVVAILSRLIAESAQVVGGWLAVIGAVAILIGTSIGYPVKDEREG